MLWSLSIGSGARGPSPELAPFRLPGSGNIFATAGQYDCVEAALVNGMGALEDDLERREKAAEIAKRAIALDRQWFLNFKPLGSIVNKLQKELIREGLNGLHVLKLPKDEIRAAIKCSNRMNAFSWLASKTRGIYIVRLKQDSLVDHAVCVDAGRRLILDSEEIHPIRLSAETLALCGGSHAKNLRLVEIRELRPKVKRSK